MHAWTLSFATAENHFSQFHILNYYNFEDITYINIFSCQEVIKRDKSELLLCKYSFFPFRDSRQVLLFDGNLLMPHRAAFSRLQV